MSTGLGGQRDNFFFDYQLPITNYQLPITNYQLPILQKSVSGEKLCIQRLSKNIVAFKKS
ncbi:hypothetical protein [Tolypothrix sp. VBCCA 56010]|uniref:hypothetical protein n=1 Tax=Tolypothrix sp. VBCCA 56010 TaxID=3137731 RepID=UPI003D7CF25B